MEESTSPTEDAGRKAKSSRLTGGALAGVYQQARPQLRRLALSRNVPRDDVDDLLQDAFAKVLKQLDSTEIENPKKYLQATVERLAADWHRNLYNRRRGHIPSPGGDDETGDGIERLLARYDHVRGNMAEQIDRVECIERVLQVMESVDPTRVLALELAFMDHTVREIGRMIGRSHQFVTDTRRIFERLTWEMCEERLDRD